MSDNLSSLQDSPRSVVAVDPGLSGAICQLGAGKLRVWRDFKVLRDIVEGVREAVGFADRVVLENVHAMPGQGVCSMFSFGKSTGVALGAILCKTGVEPVEVAPLKWQNFFRKLFGVPKGTEFNARTIALNLFPSSAPFLKRVKDHNTADAILMAAYGHSLGWK
jgi:crossover junction endodeoxyribonuclease RuvC